MASPGGSDGAPPAGLPPSTSSRLQNATTLTYKVLQDSTNDFSEERRIGEGAYGEVYLGMLENGEEIAVKRLYNKNYDTYDQQFTHEFENLTRLDHPNIVRLVGYCYEIQHIPMHHDGKRIFAGQIRTALCFEYMQKGSLEKHLSDERGGLDWRTRYKIIKGTCEGLKHLHEAVGFYHLDLKPDNILLDVNMVAKLADFGLSKIFGDEQTWVAQSVVGTPGYMAPEYIDEKLVTKKLDIFSLGVVMTKIIAGPAGHTRCVEMSDEKFLDQVNENWRNRLKARWNSPGSLQAYCTQVNKCTMIAMKCMDKDRNVRPTIVDIINKLNKTEHSIATKLWPYASVDLDAGKRKTEHDEPPPVCSTSSVARPDAPIPIRLAPSRTTHFGASGLLKITERVYVFDSCFMADVLYGGKYRQYIRDIVWQVRRYYNNAHFKVFNFQEGQRESLLSHVLSCYEITVMEYPMQYEGCPLLPMEMIHHFLRLGESWLSLDQHNVLIMHCERGGLAVLAFMLAGLLLYQKQCTGEQTTLEMVYANAPRWLIRPLTPLNHMPSQIRYLQYISRRNVRYKWPPGERQLTLDCVILTSIPDFNDEVGCRPIFRIYGQEALLGLNDFPKVLFSTPKEYVRLYKQANDDLIKADIRCHVRGDVVLECINMDPGQERDVTMFRIMFNTAFIRSRILTLDRDQIDTMWYARDRFPTDFRAEIFFLEMSAANQLDPMDSSIQEKKGLPLPVEDSEGDEALVQQPANSPEIIELRQGLVSPPPPASTSSTVRPDASPPPPLPSLPPGITSVPPPPPPPPPPYHSSKQSSSGGGNANLFVTKGHGLARPSGQATSTRSNFKPLRGEKVIKVMKGSLWEEGQADEASSEAIELDMSELGKLVTTVPPYSDTTSSDKVTSFEQSPDGAPPAGLRPSTTSSSRGDNTTATKPISLTMALLKKITDNFSETRVLGQGAYGKVYMGVHDNGQEIAVKLLYNNMQATDEKQFRHEFDNLMMLKHQNILRLVGYCYETQSQHMVDEGRLIFGETTYKALCFEYVHKGSLQKHLSDECDGLDWRTRYKIIKGICEGLKYLHEGLKEPFYHLDLKPDNILLDENMVPKLADFGLSKLFGDDQTRVTQNSIGTIIGYMPPEYLHGNLVSNKLDIFSLGVVMTKIIAGPRGNSRCVEMPHQEFLDQVHEKWRNRLQAACHASRPLEAYCEQVNICLEIALRCMEIDRHKRPNIADIIHQLNDTEAAIDERSQFNGDNDDETYRASTSNNEISPEHKLSHIKTLTPKGNAADVWMKNFTLVGRELKINELHQCIISARFSHFQVMSVWGIAGVGKSALVRKLYCARIRKNLAYRYGWVDVSQLFNLRDFSRRLLLDFHSELLQAKETEYYGNIESKNPIETCRRLLEQPCLVVIDNLKSTEEWDSIKTALVSKHSKCVIIVITTEASIAAYCADKDELVFNVKGLEADAAFDLFKHEVRKKNPRSPLNDLQGDARLQELISKCGGLPKIIVAIADLLVKKTVTLMDDIRSTNEGFMQTLETNPEYDNLRGLFDWMNYYFRTCPDALKPRIFSMSLFPRDHSIRRRRLVMRWVAEGYSRDSEDKSAEQNGEKFFSKLLDLSIIQHPPHSVTTALGDTRMVLCRVNGFIREYIVSRRMEENLVFELEGCCDPTTQRTGRHLIIRENWDRDKIVFESIDYSRLRSLTVFGVWKSFFISETMKLLRVLDLEDASGVKDTDLKQMLKLLRRLKFLSLRGCRDIYQLPRSLGDLRQLQTLDIRDTSILNLPANITKLQKLQYIRAGTSIPATEPSTSCLSASQLSELFRRRRLVGVMVPGGFHKLKALHTLGIVNISASGGKAILKDLEDLTQLRKLGVSGINRKNSKKLSSAICGHSHLESLSVQLDKDSQGCLDGIPLPLKNLQSLKLYGPVNKLPDLQIDQLSKLTKLRLEISILAQEHIKLFGDLPKLVILRICVDPHQDGEVTLCFSNYSCGLEVSSYKEVKVLKITCCSSMHVTFGAQTMKKLELLKAELGNRSQVKFSGLNNLTELKEACFMDACDETLKQDLRSQLDSHPKKPILKLEETQRSSS